MLRRFVTGSVFLALGLGASSASAAFQAGDVFYIGQAGTVVLATAGGNLSGQMLADAQGYVAGEIAFSADRSTMYFCMPNDGKVMAMDSSGTMQSFATGLTHPIGIAVLSDGHILATEWDAGEVTDITAGGDFTSATPLVQGLQRARHLLQRNDGTILVTDEYANEVLTLNYPATGVASTPFASSLLLVKSLAETADGKLYATTQWNVFDITQGGGFANKPVFASGQNFMGLAVDAQGKLLATVLNGTTVFDISAGGDFATASPWAQGLPVGDTTIARVPGPICGNGKKEPGEDCDEPRLGGGDPHVAPGRQLDAAGDAPALDGGQDRLGEGESGRAHRPRVAQLGQVAQVGARAERRVVAGEDGHPGIGVGIERHERVVQPLGGRRVDGVAAAGSADAHHVDRAPHLHRGPVVSWGVGGGGRGCGVVGGRHRPDGTGPAGPGRPSAGARLPPWPRAPLPT